MQLTPEMHAAVVMARRAMFDSLEAAHPGFGPQLYAVACSGGLCDMLTRADVGPQMAKLMDQQLQGTRYTLTTRRAN